MSLTAATAMSNPRLPAELLDHTVDLLHDSRDTLKRCCLVSKSWIPRARKHLFAATTFRAKGDLQSWKGMFPNPSTSPARYTKSLFIKRLLAAPASDAEEGGWIRTFSRVLYFKIEIGRKDDYEYLFLFHGFSPALKSLELVACSALPPWRLFNLILSFPLLEDLSLYISDRFSTIKDDHLDGKLTPIQPSSLPLFTGSLELSLGYGMDPIASRLLLLQNGLRFGKLNLSWKHEDDILLTRELVEMCCSTLETLSISNSLEEEPSLSLINLSRAMKLKGAMFICNLDPGWITSTLKTITRDHRNLQLVSIDASDVLFGIFTDDGDPEDALGQDIYGGWLGLDLLLAQLCESHSISLEVSYNAHGMMDEDDAKSLLEYLLPEVMGKGRVKLIGQEGVR